MFLIVNLISTFEVTFMACNNTNYLFILQTLIITDRVNKDVGTQFVWLVVSGLAFVTCNQNAILWSHN